MLHYVPKSQESVSQRALQSSPFLVGWTFRWTPVSLYDLVHQSSNQGSFRIAQGGETTHGPKTAKKQDEPRLLAGPSMVDDRDSFERSLIVCVNIRSTEPCSRTRGRAKRKRRKPTEKRYETPEGYALHIAFFVLRRNTHVLSVLYEYLTR